MSYTNKTPNFHLPQWIGTDCPKMADFNAAFSILDASIGSGEGSADVETPNILWVNGAYTGIVRNGSRLAPFTTISDAVAVSSGTEATVIHIAPGSYYAGETIAIHDKLKLALVVDGSGTGASARSGTTVAEISVTGTAHSLVLDGLTCERGTVILNTTLAIASIHIKNCFLTGGITILSTVDCIVTDSIIKLLIAPSANNVRAVLRATQGWVETASSRHVQLYAIDCVMLYLTHTRGTVVVMNSRLQQLVSTAENEEGNLLALESGAVSDIYNYLLGGAFYGPIRKTGDCPYKLGSFLYAPEDSVLLGERMHVEVGLSAADLSQDDPHYASATVQGALSELFTSVSDGKAALVADIRDRGGQVDHQREVPTFPELRAGIRSIPGGAPAFPVVVELQVDGGPIDRLSGHWTRNFLSILAFLLTGTFDSGGAFGEGRINLKTTTGAVWSFSRDKLLYSAGAGTTDRWIFSINSPYVGQGTEPQSLDNYAISLIPATTLSRSLLEHDFAVGAQDGVFWGSFRKEFQNITAANVTITETALYAYADTTQNWILPERTLLPAPIVLPPQSTLALTYRIGFDARSAGG